MLIFFLPQAYITDFVPTKKELTMYYYVQGHLSNIPITLLLPWYVGRRKVATLHADDVNLERPK